MNSNQHAPVKTELILLNFLCKHEILICFFFIYCYYSYNWDIVKVGYIGCNKQCHLTT